MSDSSPSPEGTVPNIESVRAHLARILASKSFAGSDRLKEFLTFVVRQSLEGKGDELKEVVIGTELFGQAGFDPKKSSAVRTTANRLRMKLAAYYKNEGKNDGLVITLPEGAYLPQFSTNVTMGSPIPPPARGDSPQAEIRYAAAEPRVNRAWRVLIGLVVILVVAGLLLLRQQGPSIEPVRVGRLLARQTSQGRSIRKIPLSHPPEYVVVSNDGRTVYATNRHGRVLSIVSSRDFTVKELRLPQDAGPMVMVIDGKIYIGSFVDGLMVLDTGKREILQRIIPTGGPVSAMTITPDGDKIYLAMDKAGLKEFSTSERQVHQVSDRICPQFLAMDRQGRSLYVTYQCSGPGGKPGHDSLEIYDVVKGTLAATIVGPPMVGGDLAVSPDGHLVLIDGWDACESPEYDHVGCPPTPGHVFHLFRTFDQRVLNTFSVPRPTGKSAFLDNSRFLIGGRSLYVVDAAKYSILENLAIGADLDGQIASAPDMSRIYVGSSVNHDLTVLEPERPECAPPSEGLAMLFSGDGTLNDSVGICTLDRFGSVTFVPGKVGQAFSLNGEHSSLTTAWTGNYRFGRHDSTLSLYFKLADLKGAQTLADQMSKNDEAGWLLIKSPDDHLEFHHIESNGDRQIVRSEMVVRADSWYQIAVATTDTRVAMYVNGRLHGGTDLAGKWKAPMDSPPLRLGTSSKGDSTFLGLLDEIAFYNRALTTKEIEALYRKREEAPCRP